MSGARASGRPASIRHRQRGYSRFRNQGGYLLLAVAVTLAVIAAAAFLINREGALHIHMSSGGVDATEVDYLAEAGLHHALWQTNASACAGDITIPSTPFGPHSYDATITAGGTTTGYKLPVDQDTWIKSDDPTADKGSLVDQHVRFESGVVEQALFRFDLSPVPAGAQINSATAWFYVESGQPHPEGPITIHRVTADWTETGANWETLDGQFDSQVLATIPAQAQSDVWVRVNLTAQVQAWVNGQPNYGILFSSSAEGIHGRYISREGVVGQQPRLDIVVGSAPASPASIQATGTLGNGVSRTLSRSGVPVHQPAATVILQPDAAAGKDTWISEWKQTWNYGKDDELDVDGEGSSKHSLLQFDLSAVPAATVLSATLELYQNDPSTWGGAVAVHRLLSNWTEGDAWASTGAANWTERESGVPWVAAGADYDALPVATTTLPAGVVDWFQWDVTSLVGGWVAGLYNNDGLVLVGGGDGAHFASSDNNDPSLRPKLTITYACECGIACVTPQGTGNVLMVVVNPTTLVPADAQKKALFESWGYTVEVISESANQSTFDTAVSNNDVVYISNTVNSSTLGNKLVDVTIGVVTEDGDYNADFGIASGAAWTTGKAIDIVDNSHYITLPFPAGTLDIYTADMEGLTVSGTEAPALQTLADRSGVGTLVVLDEGAQMASGGTAAGRRVMLPLGRSTTSNFTWDYLNNNGRLIVQRAIAWGMKADVGSAGNVLMVVGNPSSLTAQEDARKALMESWNFTVNLIDESDSQANFDAAIAANDVAYIPQDITSSNLGTKLTNATIGVVNEEGEQVDELGFSQDKLFKSRHEIDVVDSSHYITQPFATGFLTFVSSDQSVYMLSAQIAPGLQTLGQTLNTGTQYKPSLGTLDPGDELSGGGNAAGRRVQLPWGGGTFDINLLTVDGRTIMRRAIEWGAGADGGGGTQEILLVVADASSLTAQDIARKTLMEGWGYSVVTISASDSQANFDTAVASANAAYVVEQQQSTALGTKLHDATIAVISEEAELRQDIGFSANRDWPSTRDNVDIVDNSHYITSPFATGLLTIATAPIEVVSLAGQMAGGLQVLGQHDWGGPQNSLSIINTDGDLYGGGTAAGRRVQLPWGRTGFDINDLNADGLTIMQRAIEWGVAPPPVPAPVYNVLLVVGDATTLPSKDAGRKALIESWGYTVTVMDDGESQANFDAAAAAADLVYVTASVGGGTLADKLTGSTAPIVNELYGKLDNFGFSSSTSSAVSADTFSTTDSAHYITEPFNANPVTVFTTSLPMPVPGGTLAPDLQNVGQVSGTPALVTLDTGAQRYDGNPSPARRAHLPFGAAETTDLTADGETIMQRALEWAAGSGGGGGGGGSPPTCDGTFRDEFNAQVWFGSDGTLTWATDWLEINESDGPTSGDEQVVNDQSNYQLRVRDNDSGGEGVEREADLSGYASATLSLDYRRQSLDNANDHVTAEVSNNGGFSWTEIDRFQGSGTDPSYQSVSYDISAYIANNTRIRFLSSSNLGNNDMIFFDNVEICVSN